MIIRSITVVFGYEPGTNQVDPPQDKTLTFTRESKQWVADHDGLRPGELSFLHQIDQLRQKVNL